MRKLQLLIYTLLFFFSSVSLAATVAKVKGTGILIKSPSETLKTGRLYFLVSPEGKKLGIVKIKKAEEGRAIGKLLKGKARPNLELVLRKSKSKAGNKSLAKRKKTKKSSAPPPKRISKKSNKKRKSKKGGGFFSGDKSKSVGFSAGFNSNSSNVTFLDAAGNSAREDSYSGTSISYELFFDYQLMNKLHAKASLGMHNFEAGDDANSQCIGQDGSAGASCNVDLSYINLDIWLKYYFLQKDKFQIWGGAGVGVLLSPDAGTTTALNADDVATTAFIQAGAGADINITEKLYIPFWAEYGLFPSSDTVKMNQISGYVGLGYIL